MKRINTRLTVGLFGTCGTSTFRQDLLIPLLEEQGADIYNPQVADGTWDPVMQHEERYHIAEDCVQTWPVTSETYGFGTLAEQGHAIAESMLSQPMPHFIVAMIQPELDEALDDTVSRRESLRARRLARDRLNSSHSPYLYVTESIEELAEQTLRIYQVATDLIDIAQDYNPSYRRYLSVDDCRDV